MIHYETCSICPEYNIGVIDVNGIIFCNDCANREHAHNVRMVERVIHKIREDDKCKFFGMCEYRKEDGYTCNHQGEASHYCGQYRELDKQ
jgi:hypothetical protein